MQAACTISASHFSSIQLAKGNPKVPSTLPQYDYSQMQPNPAIGFKFIKFQFHFFKQKQKARIQVANTTRGSYHLHGKHIRISK